MAHLGIDLGTSNTLVAWVTDRGRPEIIEIDGAGMIPSVIYLDDQGGVPVVGKLALDMWADPGYDARCSYRRWKLEMGEGTALGTIRPGGERGDEVQVTPEYLTTLMVLYVVQQVTQGVGGDTVESVLVTVPHGWRRSNPERCRATRAAAAKAEVNGRPVTVQELTVSEPVAAAAFWIWAHRSRMSSENELVNRQVLVCDVGGGTFDVSLIRVGGESRPLDVVAAANNDFAGDFADALICSQVGSRFNELYGTGYPASAEDVLREIANPESRCQWLRQWLLTCQSTKEKVSARIRAGHRRVMPLQQRFTDPEGKAVDVNLGQEEFFQILEPLYERGRELLRELLKRDDPPYAVLFSGGGSQIAGIRERVVEPVLRDLYQGDAETILGRIDVNQVRMDQAIALGAALIANGVESVQERLLHDVGLLIALDPRHPQLPLALGVSPSDPRIILTPIVARGTIVPTTVSSRDLGVNTTIGKGQTVDVGLVIDDHSENPWIQQFTLSHPGDGREQSLHWSLEIDAEGLLRLVLTPAHGRAASVVANVEPTASGRASLMVGPPRDDASWRRIDPKTLREVIAKLDSGGAH